MGSDHTLKETIDMTTTLNNVIMNELNNVADAGCRVIADVNRHQCHIFATSNNTMMSMTILNGDLTVIEDLLTVSVHSLRSTNYCTPIEWTDAVTQVLHNMAGFISQENNARATMIIQEVINYYIQLTNTSGNVSARELYSNILL